MSSVYRKYNIYYGGKLQCRTWERQHVYMDRILACLKQEKGIRRKTRSSTRNRHVINRHRLLATRCFWLVNGHLGTRRWPGSRGYTPAHERRTSRSRRPCSRWASRSWWTRPRTAPSSAGTPPPPRSCLRRRPPRAAAAARAGNQQPPTSPRRRSWRGEPRWRRRAGRIESAAPLFCGGRQRVCPARFCIDAIWRVRWLHCFGARQQRHASKTMHVKLRDGGRCVPTAGLCSAALLLND